MYEQDTIEQTRNRLEVFLKSFEHPAQQRVTILVSSTRVKGEITTCFASGLSEPDLITACITTIQNILGSKERIIKFFREVLKSPEPW